MLESIEKLRDCTWIGGGKVNEFLDEIEQEISERYMLLPVDANDEPIHMGDTVEGELLFDNATVKGTVTTYHIHDNDEPDTVYIKVDCGSGTWTIKELRTKRCRHVKPRTIEDVLHDFANEAEWEQSHDSYEEIESRLITLYAAEIREMMGGE